MVRTQIQLPEPLYREVKRVAKQLDWSVAEVLRRGAESIARAYPAARGPEMAKWSMPAPVKASLTVLDPGLLKDIIQQDMEQKSLG